MKELFFYFFQTGDFPREITDYLKKYYKRDYISSKGKQHAKYLAWKQEFEDSRRDAIASSGSS